MKKYRQELLNPSRQRRHRRKVFVCASRSVQSDARATGVRTVFRQASPKIMLIHIPTPKKQTRFENNKVSQAVEPPMEQDIKSANTDAEDIHAQDNEESVAVPAKQENVKKKVEKDNTIKQPVKAEVVAKPVVNPNSLYKKKTTTDGTTGKPGNQGREDGKAGAGNYGGTGTGSGTGDGSGTGSGSGSGSGSGTGGGKGGGTGNGISFDLGGRQARSLQKPFYNSPEQGKIVVSIKVDKLGKVTYASAGAKGTDISETNLRKQAEDAALKTVFAPDDNAPEEQRGTITYKFFKVK